MTSSGSNKRPAPDDNEEDVEDIFEVFENIQDMLLKFYPKGLETNAIPAAYLRHYSVELDPTKFSQHKFRDMKDLVSSGLCNKVYTSMRKQNKPSNLYNVFGIAHFGPRKPESKAKREKKEKAESSLVEPAAVAAPEIQFNYFAPTVSSPNTANRTEAPNITPAMQHPSTSVRPPATVALEGEDVETTLDPTAERRNISLKHQGTMKSVATITDVSGVRPPILSCAHHCACKCTISEDPVQNQTVHIPPAAQTSPLQLQPRSWILEHPFGFYRTVPPPIPPPTSAPGYHVLQLRAPCVPVPGTSFVPFPTINGTRNYYHQAELMSAGRGKMIVQSSPMQSTRTTKSVQNTEVENLSLAMVPVSNTADMTKCRSMIVPCAPTISRGVATFQRSILGREAWNSRSSALLVAPVSGLSFTAPQTCIESVRPALRARERAPYVVPKSQIRQDGNLRSYHAPGSGASASRTKERPIRVQRNEFHKNVMNCRNTVYDLEERQLRAFNILKTYDEVRSWHDDIPLPPIFEINPFVIQVDRLPKEFKWDHVRHAFPKASLGTMQFCQPTTAGFANKQVLNVLFWSSKDAYDAFEKFVKESKEIPQFEAHVSFGTFGAINRNWSRSLMQNCC